MKTKIHVNQHIIKSNRKNKEAAPVLTCKTYKENKYASEVAILDDEGEIVGKFIYSPDKPLSCGAHVWFETDNQIQVLK